LVSTESLKPEIIYLQYFFNNTDCTENSHLLEIHLLKKTALFYQLLKNKLHFFISCSKTNCTFLSAAQKQTVEHIWNTFFEQLTFSVEQMTFFFQSVEQSRFEQLDFEQLTPS
jgi:hypothetical protein